MNTVTISLSFRSGFAAKWIIKHVQVFRAFWILDLQVRDCRPVNVKPLGQCVAQYRCLGPGSQ